ncbi:MAG: DNA-directed RNA polymerase subunit beta [Candidatus Firestonebacteria bacterium]|nr:DNA-directed RNA polymerase subunit beta [Candidatus Firestonebacteria bacterium]
MQEFDMLGKRKRKDYSKLRKIEKIPNFRIQELPNLIEVQKKSYYGFLQQNIAPDKRENLGLQGVINEIFPIVSLKGNITLEFVKYTLGEPKFSVGECKEREQTYGVPLKFNVRMIITDLENPSMKVKEIKEQEIYVCQIPLMTENGTFIINGAERVIVSQLHRSPGISFDELEDKLFSPFGKIYTAKVVPYRGSWLEFEFDTNEILYARIDKKRKFFATIMLRALGYSTNEDIIKLFYKSIEANVKDKEKVLNKKLAKNVDLSKGVAILAGKTIDQGIYESLIENDIKKIEIIEALDIDDKINLIPTIIKDTVNPTKEDAIMEIYKKMRPGQPVTLDTAKVFFNNMFFNSKRYDLGKVGRYKINKKLYPDKEKQFKLEERVLKNEDINRTIKYLLKLSNGSGDKDDIDHFGNRRVRAVGELAENQFRIGLVRMERLIREKMSMVDTEVAMPSDIINTKPIFAALREFFGTNQLSQFMDQTNPLAELTHKRRLSALGPGGLDRDRAGFEVRDVHYTHYGRMCPIETPEGPNIGLISSLSSYARINELGFIETPYREVKNGVVTGKIEFLAADKEDEFTIAQANTPLDEKCRLVEKMMVARNKGDFPLVPAEKINYMDVSPMQLVSISTALIPFLEHDDANRALMGSNMQRQSVPLVKSEAPIIGTGIEYKVAYDSEVMVVAKNAGIVEYVDAKRIEIYNDEKKLDVYTLTKYKRSNQDTCINQRPIVSRGQKIGKGQVIADGPCTEKGELALGQNVMVALMPWRGYNFEDAIVLNENLLKEDKFSSIHVEEFSIEARDTKLGEEEITRDIPNVSEEALRNLDDGGIVRIGAEVNPGDILVGKVTPKGESESTPEEKLLRAIFGEKAKDVKNASLKVPPGASGIVVDIKIFSRKESTTKVQDKEIRKKVDGEYLTLVDEVHNEKDMEIAFIKKNNKNKKEIEEEIKIEKEKAKLRIEEIEFKKSRELDNLAEGDNLPAGVIKLVKVYLATKRKIEVGDKMAGRHGNKGIIAKIVPHEDMPYLPDGRPVDIVLNPLGVPGRMNVGQVLEAHLGWAAKVLGYYVSTPVFDGATELEVKDALEEAGLPRSGKTLLYDGVNGEKFDSDVTVGNMYIMKLSHLVDDKVHARSTGPYSLITQQPLGGKAQFGGQRFGEMEVWALEAYGAANILQEILTVKSDDVTGRTKMYEAIVKGRNTPEPGLPESFNVLVKELQGLGLDVSLIKDSKDGGAKGVLKGTDSVESEVVLVENTFIEEGDEVTSKKKDKKSKK